MASKQVSANKQFDLTSAYTELSRACSAKAYAKVLAASNKILSKNPREVKAFQCKIVALIHLEKYEECISTIKKSPDLSKYVLLEKAYTEYRLNRMKDAAKTLESTVADNIAVQELKAQVHYREEEFQEAYSCIRKVIKESQDDYGEERLTNLVAVAAAAACFKKMHIDIDVNPSMYETYFNLACYHLGRGDYTGAESLLQKAESVCRESLQEDPEVTEDEINEELAHIRVQRAFILQRQKNEEAANELYQSVVRQRSGDPALLAVAANNIICINREQNIFDSRKRIKMASAEGLQHKLFAKQRAEILVNQGLFYWHTNQPDACHAKARAVLEEDPSCPRATLLMAAQLMKEKQHSSAVKLLENFCATYPLVKSAFGTLDKRSGVVVPLALAQLRLSVTSSKAPATQQRSVNGIVVEEARPVVELLGDLLAGSEAHLFSPGLLATRIALLLWSDSAKNKGDTGISALDSAVSLIDSALKWQRTNGDPATYAHLLDKVGTFLLRHGHAKEAAELFEQQLAQLDLAPTKSGLQPLNEQQKVAARQAVLARLIRAYAQYDKPKAEAASKSLKFTDSLSPQDIDTLESAFLYGAKYMRRQVRTGDQQLSNKQKQQQTKHGRVLLPTTPSSPDTQQLMEVVNAKKQSRSRKKRKVRLPKNYQPGVVPDPDRWLPKHERAHHRGKRRDKRQVSSRGPQGQASGGADLDASTRSPKTAPQLASPRADATTSAAGSKSVSSAVRQQQRKGRKKGR